MDVMKRILNFAVILAAVLQLASCVTAPAPQMVEGAATVFVVSKDWHTSIVLARTDLPDGSIPESGDIPASRYLEFGWGDAEYYPAKDPTFSMALRAGFLPTPSTLHVEGFADEPGIRYPEADVEAVQLDIKGLTALVEFIHGSFLRGGEARAQTSAPGLSSGSRFYPAKCKFHFLFTSNSWTARALKDGGVDIDVGTSKFAHNLIHQVREARWKKLGRLYPVRKGPYH